MQIVKYFRFIVIKGFKFSKLLALSIFSLSVAGCRGYSEFYDLGQGFKYGFFDTKRTLNVFYSDQGIVHGICYSVEWNDKYIMMRYYPYDSGGNLLGITRISLIEKSAYAKSPLQLESNAIISSSEDSVGYLLGINKIHLTNKREIVFDERN